MKTVIYTNGQRFVSQWEDGDKEKANKIAQGFRDRVAKSGKDTSLVLELADGETLVMFEEAIKRATFIFEE